MKTSYKNGWMFAILLLAAFPLIYLFSLNPIPQALTYHHFSDQQAWLLIPNGLNVLSNIPFLVVGVWGILALHKDSALKIIAQHKLAYYALFLGSGLVAFGSGYYHLWPDNQTLVWDRLPMTIAFMALLSIVITEFMSVSYGRMLFFPLIIIGLASVIYWYITEQNGVGDLRPYIAVQFFPMLAMPVIILCGKPRFTQVSGYWLLFLAYVIAKLLEHFDAPIHHFLGVISGHSLKHVSAAIGLYYLLRSYKTRDACIPN